MNRIRIAACALLLAGVSGYGGTFSADFATQDTSAFILNGAGLLPDANTWYPVIATNRLVLTINSTNLSGSISPNDFDNASPIESFVAKFKLQFGPGSGNAADGAAFSFGPDINQFSTTYNEVGAGGASFAISFHTYTSNGGPAVDAYLFGQRIGHFPIAKTNMVNSKLQDVTIQLKKNSTLDVTYAGSVIFTNLYMPDWGPTNGYFIISGRTGGETEETDIANLSINTTLLGTLVAPTITADPVAVSVKEGNSASFSVAFDGTGPFTIQWLKNGTPIQDATNQNVTLSPVLYADNNSKISARVTNQAGSTTSAGANVSVTPDTTAPTVVKASGDMSFSVVTITYSKPVSDSALNKADYSFDQGVTVSAVDRVNTTTVKLTTSKMTQNSTYTLTINGVQDISTTPNTIAANTKVTVRTFVFMADTALHSKYMGFPDNSRAPAVMNDPRFGVSPDRRDLITAFEYPANGNGRDGTADPARNYADTIESFFIPATTGNYVFFTAGADYWALYLSTDESPANKNLICEVGGWTNPRGWNTGQGGTSMINGRSDTFSNPTWPTGNTITLTAGQRYYMLLLHTDPSWAGGDDFGATFKLEGAADPAAGDPPKLTGNLIGYYIDPDGASITFDNQPQNASAQEGGSVTFSVVATGVSAYGTNVTYQWQAAPKNSTTFTNIPGATSASYSTPPLLRSIYDGMQFRVVGSVPPITQNSAIAVLTVSANTTPPVATAGAMLDSTPGVVDIGIGFDKPMDDASASALANYSVSAGTVVSLTWNSNRFTANSQNPAAMVRKQTALLKVSGIAGTSGTVTIKNVKDIYGNTLTSATLPFTINTNMQWGVVGANQDGGWNAVVPVTANGFDVYSDGSGEWGNYDEATFVYEQVTGDFDKKLRVEYQDGSSQWARAGLVVRDVTNFGVNAAAQQGSQPPGNSGTPPFDGKAGRYQKMHVNPVGATLTGPGNLGNASWEGNRRLDTGGPCSSALNAANGVPQYPNAWCRIKRVGQTFTVYRSDDGVNWITMGSTTWGQDDASKSPMPNTLFVGPEFSPETGNVSQAADRGTFLAQFRDYGNYVAVFNPQLKVGSDPSGKVTVTWTTGTLVSSPTVNGNYSPVQNATSPFQVTPAPGSTTFYKVKP
ncbi:MAG TPA: hypothetical protein VKY92_12840 [Verrucomicrobiae bacterium]|nr:hypothetical protein [Verrucomicrobiae bacterium]